MGDTFFKIFFIACFVILFAAGAIMFLAMERESANEFAIQRYISSRGKAPLPRSWRGRMGEGI